MLLLDHITPKIEDSGLISGGGVYKYLASHTQNSKMVEKHLNYH